MKRTELNARPHLNGNSPESFQAAGLKIHEAATALELVMRETLGEITHGRNYQHLPPTTTSSAQLQDLACIAKITNALFSLKDLGVELVNAGDAHV